MREAAARHAALVLFPELGLSAYSCDDLFQQRALLDGLPGRAAPRSSARPPSSPCSPSWACRWPSTTCSTTARWWWARGGSSASSPRPTCPTTGSSTRRRQFRRATWPCARRSTLGDQRQVPFGSRLLFEVEEQPLLRLPRGDLRGPLGAGPAVLVRRPGRGHRAPQPLGLQRHRGQGRLSTGAGGQPVRALPGRLSLLRRGAGRVDHRSGLGRPRPHLRERRPCWPSRERFPPAPAHRGATSTSSGSRQERMRQESFGQSVERHRDELRRYRAVRTSLAAAAAGTPAPRARVRALPLRSGRSGHARRALRRGVPDPGAGAGQAPATSPESSGWSSASRAGLDSTHALLVCAQAMDHLGYPRRQHPRLHDAGLRHERPHPRSGAPPHAGGRVRGQRARHPTERRADAAGHRPSVRRAGRRSTT